MWGEEGPPEEEGLPVEPPDEPDADELDVQALNNLLLDGVDEDGAAEIDNILFDAVWQGDEDLVEDSLDQGAFVDYVGDEDGSTPIMIAAQNGDLDIVQILAEHGADLERQTVTDGYDALMLAAHYDWPDVCLFLIGQGLDPTQEDFAGETASSLYGSWLDAEWRAPDETRPALTTGQKHERREKLTTAHYLYRQEQRLLNACTSGILHEALGALACGAYIEQQFDSRTALIVAAEHGHLALVKMLSDHGANLHRRAWEEGYNALMTAAHYDFPDICLFLISRGLNPALEDNNGETALSLYASWLDPEWRSDDQVRPPLTSDEKTARCDLLVAARAEHLALLGREERYQRRKNFLLLLRRGGFILSKAQRFEQQLAQIAVDTSAHLDPVDRSTPAANRAYLHHQVFGHVGLQRLIIGFL